MSAGLLSGGTQWKVGYTGQESAGQQQITLLRSKWRKRERWLGDSMCWWGGGWVLTFSTLQFMRLSPSPCVLKAGFGFFMHYQSLTQTFF